MLQWLGFGVFCAVMFGGYVLSMSEICSDHDKSSHLMFSMGGQFMIIAPVASIGPLLADCLFLDCALAEVRYGWSCSGIFATGYLIYCVAGFIIGDKIARNKKQRTDQTDQNECTKLI